MKIKSITKAGLEPVFNLEVPETHAFSIAGGLITHNCYDAIRYWCISRPWSLPEPKNRKDGWRDRLFNNDDTWATS